MKRIFITGSADGLGQLAARFLVDQGYNVVLHARSQTRGEQALHNVPGAETVVTGDLSSIDETKELADKVNSLGNFDAVIHNAAVYTGRGKEILAINTVAPYVLTCLIDRPEPLIYVSSGMHRGGQAKLENFMAGAGNITYSDSKLHMLMLGKAVARRWPESYSNAVDPGWVPTKMGGANAPDRLEDGYETQAWLAVSDDEGAKVTGRYFYHKQQNQYDPAADDVNSQDKLLEMCAELTGVYFP